VQRQRRLGKGIRRRHLEALNAPEASYRRWKREGEVPFALSRVQFVEVTEKRLAGQIPQLGKLGTTVIGRLARDVELGGCFRPPEHWSMTTLMIAVWFGICGVTTADDLRVADARADAERRQRELKAQHDRLTSEHKKKIEQMQKQSKADQQRLKDKHAAATKANAGSARPAIKPYDPAPTAPPFNAASAPSPEDCLWAFVRATRSATSMEQVYPYLPVGQAHTMREMQARYDPKQAAESRKSWLERDPKMSKDTLDHLTGPPNDWDLKFHKDIAKDIIQILSVHIEGNEALLRVSTHSDAVINGAKYPYGTARIELIGEGSYWKLSRYEDGIMAYQEPPQK